MLKKQRNMIWFRDSIQLKPSMALLTLVLNLASSDSFSSGIYTETKGTMNLFFIPLPYPISPSQTRSFTLLTNLIH
jgi:hypothetical protein